MQEEFNSVGFALLVVAPLVLMAVLVILTVHHVVTDRSSGNYEDSHPTDGLPSAKTTSHLPSEVTDYTKAIAFEEAKPKAPPLAMSTWEPPKKKPSYIGFLL